MPLRSMHASPLVIDDGTPRIVEMTSTICSLHAVVGADGRALYDYAVSLSSEYAYLYGEEFSLEELLMGIAEDAGDDDEIRIEAVRMRIIGRILGLTCPFHPQKWPRGRNRRECRDDGTSVVSRRSKRCRGVAQSIRW
ncbi:hypothetical protein ACHAXA_011020 [Cyclostephanos tholiformis]|uniref:Uncharacterized protein n=1 Tax=Cyclostephanos tholiformis TaxID=382380 RepID=A0ABD3R3A4_9STRA